MSTDGNAIFDAALALPEQLRADLAARLIESLDASGPAVPDRSPEDWEAEIIARSDAVHRGEAELIDGEQIADMLQGIVDRDRDKP